MTIRTARATSFKQRVIIAALKNQSEITLAEAVQLIGRDIFTNASKHVGAVLSNMAKRGMITRIKPGVFTLPKSTACGPTVYQLIT